MEGIVMLIVSLVFISVFLYALSNNNKTYRKRWGKDEYRIQIREYFTDGIKRSEIYFIEQKCKHFLFGEAWVAVKFCNYGWGDVSWDECHYKTIEEAEDAIKRLRAGDKWYGNKETIIKYIP